VKYEWDDEILRFSQPNLEYGQGKEIFYNYPKIELELAHNLVSGKAMIDVENIPEFEFHRELFHGSSTILHDVRQKVPQESLPADKIAAIKINNDRIESNAVKILAALEFVLAFVKKTGVPTSNTLTSAPKKTNNLPTIMEYCKHWNLGTPDISLIPDVGLQYLASLYEEVEDILADKYDEWLDTPYNAPITSTMEQELQEMESHFPIDVLVVVFRRFMFRYLSAEKIKPEQPLSSFLPLLLLCWPFDKIIKEEALQQVFPKSLLIANSFYAYTYYRELLETRQKKQQKVVQPVSVTETMGKSHNQQQTPGSTIKPKRKQSQKFNNM